VCECVVAVVAGAWFTRAIGEDGRYAWGVVVVVVFSFASIRHILISCFIYFVPPIRGPALSCICDRQVAV
jgi:hypothetical protein